MKVVFVSNFYNHHQSSFSENMFKLLGEDYHFVQTEKMSDEREKMGWGNIEFPSFVIKSYENSKLKDESINLINNGDIVIFGAAPLSMISERLRHRKTVFFYEERPFKEGFNIFKFPVRIVRWNMRYRDYTHKSFLLCASAYTYADYLKLNMFRNRAYKWGYFPEFKKHLNVDKLIETKQPSSILWVARLIDLKHPEIPIIVAKKLKDNGYKFNLNLIGSGELELKIKQQITDYDLCDCVKMLGSMTPEEVRTNMEKSEIFMFTSDFNEGWGAVLNESMNSACAVVASHAIGAVPFLIKDKENGLIYKNGDVEDCYNKVKYLLANVDIRKIIAKKAYETMANEWNAEVAAKRFIELSTKVLDGDKKVNIYKDGPCSISKKLKNGWYKK